MTPKGRVLVLMCAVLAALLVPTGAAASSNPSEGVEDGYARAHLAGTHGYRITILALGRDLIVTATKGTASVTYFLIKSGLEGDRIHARLPGVGRVFLEFHERRRPHGRAVHGCRESETARKGVFVGTVKIRREHGYTSALSHHVRGEILQEGNGECHRRPAAHASSSASRLLSASTSRGKGYLSFSTFNFPSLGVGSDLLFGASLARKRGHMFVLTTQNAVDKDPAALEIAAPPRSASVTPPAPFTGSATFQQESSKDFSWAGDLAVELPGVGEVSLAGPKFETSLRRSQVPRRQERNRRQLDHPRNPPLRQRLPLPAFGAGQALFAEVAAELVQLGRLEISLKTRRPAKTRGRHLRPARRSSANASS
jgi:hypothetical protein